MRETRIEGVCIVTERRYAKRVAVVYSFVGNDRGFDVSRKPRVGAGAHAKACTGDTRARTFGRAVSFAHRGNMYAQI